MCGAYHLAYTLFFFHQPNLCVCSRFSLCLPCLDDLAFDARDECPPHCVLVASFFVDSHECHHQTPCHTYRNKSCYSKRVCKP
ncbi:hypothetical protein Hanom_Chr04g00325871 [Helianthus anomalus]